MDATKVLIVDDEPNILILMEQALESLEDDYGIELLTADNGEEALEQIRRERPCLVFLDVMMPIMSGLDVCQQLKADPDLKDTYVVMLTAKGQELDRQHGLEMGADLYMTKPFRPREVLETSLEVLNLITSAAI